jgi:hypothetical protein
MPRRLPHWSVIGVQGQRREQEGGESRPKGDSLPS